MPRTASWAVIGHAAARLVNCGSMVRKMSRPFGFNPLTPMPRTTVVATVDRTGWLPSTPGGAAGWAMVVAPSQNRYPAPATVNAVRATGVAATNAPRPVATAAVMAR